MVYYGASQKEAAATVKTKVGRTGGSLGEAPDVQVSAITALVTSVIRAHRAKRK